MGQALYRKYRSKKLDEIIGQSHVITTLKNALRNGRISHAYLLTGPRGVGKTSVARILAHEVNGFNYDENQQRLDIIEIDAASNRRIDEIRELRDKVNIAPTAGKYKVYIIDEVHMLTKEAFNALLKTLEEPPAHVIFILATTEPHKLPETIISRTQRYSFKPIKPGDISTHLKQIIKAEGLSVSYDAINLIAEHSDGSMRDALSLLDQASSIRYKVNLDDIQSLLGIAPNESLDNLINGLSGSSPQHLLELLQTFKEKGLNAAIVSNQLSERLRHQLISNKLALDPPEISKLLRQLIEVPSSSSPDRLLEIILLDVVLSHAGNSHGSVIHATLGKPAKSTTTSKEKLVLKKEALPPANLPTRHSKIKKSNKFSIEVWPQVLETIKSQHNTLYSIVRMGKPSFSNNQLTIKFEFSFHLKRINEAKNHQIIVDVLNQYSDEPIELVAKLITSANTKGKLATHEVETISNIFGGAEVLDF